MLPLVSPFFFFNFFILKGTFLRYLISTFTLRYFDAVKVLPRRLSVGALLSCLHSRVYQSFQGKVLRDSKCLLSVRDAAQKVTDRVKPAQPRTEGSPVVDGF